MALRTGQTKVLGGANSGGAVRCARSLFGCFVAASLGPGPGLGTDQKARTRKCAKPRVRCSQLGTLLNARREPPRGYEIQQAPVAFAALIRACDGWSMLVEPATLKASRPHAALTAGDVAEPLE